MPDDPGMVGYGSTVEIKIGAGAFTQVDGIYELTMPTPTVNNPQAPAMNLPNNAMQRVPGKVIDYGQTSFSLAWIPGSEADDLLQSLITLGTPFTVRETLPNGVSWSLTGLFASMSQATPWDDRMTATVTLDASGAPTIGAATVPVNTVLPAISGELAVGDVLTAYEGKWTGGVTSYAYQWKNAAANIVGATQATYTLQAGDAGDSITVVVTASNSAGAGTPATSAPVVAEA
jgi:hypothetical protein